MGKKTQSKSLFSEGVHQLIDRWSAYIPAEFRERFREDTESLEVIHENQLGTIARMAEQRERQSNIDDVTKVSTRRHFSKKLVDTFNKRRPEGVSIIAVFFVDIDKFKAINDKYGHPVGDRYLFVTATIIAETIRTNRGTDFLERVREGPDDLTIGRWGGDEFIGCVEVTDDDGLEFVASRLKSAINDPFKQKQKDPSLPVPFTASVGFAAYCLPKERSSIAPNHIATELITKVDQEMYKSKEDGLLHILYVDQVGGKLIEQKEKVLS